MTNRGEQEALLFKTGSLQNYFPSGDPASADAETRRHLRELSQESSRGSHLTLRLKRTLLKRRDKKRKEATGSHS